MHADSRVDTQALFRPLASAWLALRRASGRAGQLPTPAPLPVHPDTGRIAHEYALSRATLARYTH